MSDLISRTQAIDAINHICPVDTEYDCTLLDRVDVRCVLSDLPSAEPHKIRCKDCKHWIPYDWMFSEVWRSKNIADYPEDEIGCEWCDMAMKANDFCSRGERKTE